MGRRLVAGTIVSMVLLVGVAAAALAELRVCNRSNERATVSIGYPVEKDDWLSEGWWVVPIGECVTVLPDALTSRYYFFYAVGGARGAWSGPVKQLTGWFCTPRHGYMFQLTEHKYRLRNDEYQVGPNMIDCSRPGSDLEGKKFRLVDKGDARDYTIELTNDSRDQLAR